MFADREQPSKVPLEPANSGGTPEPATSAVDREVSALTGMTAPSPSHLKTGPDSAATPGQKITYLYHSTSPNSLPLIVQYGLYLSSERFTVFVTRPRTDWGWTDNLVALVIRPTEIRVDRTAISMGIGFPDRVKFPPGLKAELTRLDALWEERDHSVFTSKKSDELRAAVSGAHYLLSYEQAGTLRHFPPECIDIAKSREGNQHGRYRAIANAYLDALERNGGHPVTTPVELPSRWTRSVDALTFPIRRRMANRTDPPEKT